MRSLKALLSLILLYSFTLSAQDTKVVGFLSFEQFDFNWEYNPDKSYKYGTRDRMGYKSSDGSELIISTDLLDEDRACVWSENFSCNRDGMIKALIGRHSDYNILHPKDRFSYKEFVIYTYEDAAFAHGIYDDIYHVSIAFMQGSHKSKYYAKYLKKLIRKIEIQSYSQAQVSELMVTFSLESLDNRIVSGEYPQETYQKSLFSNILHPELLYSVRTNHGSSGMLIKGFVNQLILSCADDGFKPSMYPLYFDRYTGDINTYFYKVIPGMQSYMALITKPVGYQDYETSCFEIKESRIYGKWILREFEVNNESYLLLNSANYLIILDSAYNDVFTYKVLHDETKSPAFQFDCYQGSGEVRCNVVGYASKDPILDDILNNKEKWAAESLITCYSSWRIDRNPAGNDEIFMASYLSGELINAYRIFWNGEAFELSKELTPSQKNHQFIGELKKYSQKPDF